jgi:uncharacterized protein GlcG (DUF336 family)
MNLPYSLARVLASVAESDASALGVPMSIAVVDKDGGIMFLGRMDGALPASREIAASKAYTAAALRMTTADVGKLAQPGGALYGIQHTHPGKIVLFGGGIPLCLKGKEAGAIGISGGSVDEDIQVAESVVQALADMEGWSQLIKGVLSKARIETACAARLEIKVSETLHEMNHPLSPRGHSIFVGAMILAACEGQ